MIMLDEILGRIINYLKSPMGGRIHSMYPDCSAYEFTHDYKSLIYNDHVSRVMMGKIIFLKKPLESSPVVCKTRGSNDYLFGWINTDTDVIAYVFWRRDSGALREKIAYLESHGYSIIGGDMIA